MVSNTLTMTASAERGAKPGNTGIACPTTSEEVAAASVDLFYRQALLAVVGNLLGATVLTAVIWNSVPRAPMAVWLLAMGVSLLVRTGFALGYQQFPRPDKKESPLWRNRLAVTTLLSGGLWGLAGYLFWLPELPIHQQLTLLLALVGVAATGSSTANDWTSVCSSSASILPGVKGTVTL